MLKGYSLLERICLFLFAPNPILKQLTVCCQKKKKKLFVYCTLHNGFIQFPSVSISWQCYMFYLIIMFTVFTS